MKDSCWRIISQWCPPRIPGAHASMMAIKFSAAQRTLGGRPLISTRMVGLPEAATVSVIIHRFWINKKRSFLKNLRIFVPLPTERGYKGY